MTILPGAADAGGFDTSGTLAGMLAEQGNLDELGTRADDELQRARRARSGEWVGDRYRTVLAEALAERGDLDELRARADAGDSCAADRLAQLLADHAHPHRLRTLADARSPPAPHRLARPLADPGGPPPAAQ